MSNMKNAGEHVRRRWRVVSGAFLALCLGACAEAPGEPAADEAGSSAEEAEGRPDLQGSIEAEAQIEQQGSDEPASLISATSEAVLYTSGTPAAKAWFNSGPGMNYWDFKDEKCDGKSPILFWRIRGGLYSYKLTTGCGTEKRIYLTQGQPGDRVEYYIALTTSFATSSHVFDYKR